MIKLVSLFSGSSGNSIFLSSGNTRILIDAGLSGKRIEKALSEAGEQPANLDAVLVTHEHSDHTMGIGVLARRYHIPVYTAQGTWLALSAMTGKMKEEQRCVIVPGKSFLIGDITVEPFTIPHDAAEPVGFTFYIENKKISISTDIGHMTKTILNQLLGSHIVLLESNHDINMLKMGKYPWPLKQRILGENGHLDNDMAGKVVAHLVQNGTRCILLGHLSKENNFPELAWQTAVMALAEKNLTPGEDVMMEVVLRDRASSIVWASKERIWLEPFPFQGLLPEQITLEDHTGSFEPGYSYFVPDFQQDDKVAENHI